MENYLKREKGITLVALIVTIIVLLILAGISISMITNTNLNEYSNSIIQQEENCQHDYVITSKWDYFKDCYKTISKCSKCGKEVE